MRKNILKKSTAVLAAVVLAAMTLSGCGAAPADSTSQTETQNEAEATEGTEEAESTDAETTEADEATDTESDAETDAEIDTDTDAEASSEDTTAADPSAHLTAKEFTEKIIAGWNLGNTFDAYSGQAGELRNDGLSTETCWGNPKTSQAIIDTVKDAGFNTIRIPVTWYTHMDPNTYEIDQEWMDRVHEVVDYALDDDTYVIINMHHDTGTNGWLKASDTNLDQKKEIFEAIWTQVATSFADYDDNLVFESFNEILNDNNDWSNPDKRALEIVNELNQIFVDTVRSTGTSESGEANNNADRVLIVNTYCAGTAKPMLNYFVAPTDTVEGAICGEVHAYTPYQYTAPEFPNDKSWSESDLKSNFQTIKTAFQLMKIPVIIGEFGVVDKNNEADRLKYIDYYVTTAKEMGLKCIWWDNGITKEFGIINRKTLDLARASEVQAIIDAANRD